MSRRAVRGWFGGTFDPVHYGHLDVAKAAHEALALDHVTLVPAHLPPHRSLADAAAIHRVAMLTLAATEPWQRISTLEIELNRPSRTSVTLDVLSADGADPESMVVITGADAFAGILSWSRATELLRRVNFAVVSRPGHPVHALREALPTLAPLMCTPSDWLTRQEPAVVLVDATTAPVSSTDIRAAVAAGRTLERLVPAPVGAYIAAHGLYKKHTGAS